jgi:hypothetical protein
MTDQTAPEITEDVLEQIRAAETAAQASVVTIPDGDLPDDLAKALERRVEVNAAQYDGKTVVRVGGRDAEVRRLEAPWSRRQAPEATQTRGSRRRRANKKATSATTRKDA